MKCTDCKHLTEHDDPGGGSWTGPGSQSLSCGLGRWYMGMNELTRADLRLAVVAAETCEQFEALEKK